MLRILLLVAAFAASATTFTAQASYQSNHQQEFNQIKHRFDKIKPLIAKVAKETHTHPGLLTTIAFRESRFNAKARNTQGSSAAGLMQITRGTKKDILAKYGKELGLSRRANIDNPEVSLKLAAALLRENRIALRRILKREPTHAEEYLAYKYGQGGVVAILKHKPKVARHEIKMYQNAASFYSAKVKLSDAPETILAENKVSEVKMQHLKKIWETIYGSEPTERLAYLSRFNGVVI